MKMMDTILPTSTSSEDSTHFDHPATLVDLATGKEYPLKEGEQSIGRYDQEGPHPDVAIETDDPYISRIHIHIEVTRITNGKYIHSLRIDENAKNDIIIGGNISQRDNGNERTLSKDQVIQLPLVRLRVKDK